MPKTLPKVDPAIVGGEPAPNGAGEGSIAPDPRDPLKVALEAHLIDVRMWTEYLTNGDPSTVGMVDFGTWRTLESWTRRVKAMDIIDSILQQRLKLGFPYDQKAIILAQLIPESRLAPYATLLKPLLPPPPPDPAKPDELPPPPPMHYNPLIATIATALHTTASAKGAEAEAAKKAEEAKKAEDEQIKNWQIWSDMYGRTGRADWRPHPGNVESRYWGWNEIGKEDWWKNRNG